MQVRNAVSGLEGKKGVVVGLASFLFVRFFSSSLSPFAFFSFLSSHTQEITSYFGFNLRWDGVSQLAMTHGCEINRWAFFFFFFGEKTQNTCILVFSSSITIIIYISARRTRLWCLCENPAKVDRAHPQLRSNNKSDIDGRLRAFKTWLIFTRWEAFCNVIFTCYVQFCLNINLY